MDLSSLLSLSSSLSSSSSSFVESKPSALELELFVSLDAQLLWLTLRRVVSGICVSLVVARDGMV